MSGKKRKSRMLGVSYERQNGVLGLYTHEYLEHDAKTKPLDKAKLDVLIDDTLKQIRSSEAFKDVSKEQLDDLRLQLKRMSSSMLSESPLLHFSPALKFAADVLALLPESDFLQDVEVMATSAPGMAAASLFQADISTICISQGFLIALFNGNMIVLKMAKARGFLKFSKYFKLHQDLMQLAFCIETRRKHFRL